MKQMLFRRAAIRALVVCGVAVVSSGRLAIACSGPVPSGEQMFRTSGAVFRGTVVERREIPDARGWRPNVESRVAVAEVYKGLIGDEIIVAHETRSSCGIDFRVGQQRMFLTGFLEEGRVRTSLPRMIVRGGSDGPELIAVARRFRDEVAAAERRMQQHPGNLEARLAVASLLEAWGDLDRAERAYADVAVGAPADPRVLLGQGRSMVSRGRFLDALAPLSAVLTARPRDTDARFLLDLARARTGETEVPIDRDLPTLRLMNFSSNVLPRLSLRERNLSRAVFAQVQVDRLDLAEARLEGATFIGSSGWGIFDVSDADLSNARVEHSTFATFVARNARLAGAVFHDVQAVLGYADLSYASAEGVTLNSVRLSMLRAPGARFDDARFADVGISRADLRGARFNGATLNNVGLRNADFSSASLAGVRATNLDLHGSSFDDTVLTRANLVGARLTGMTITRTDFSDAVLSGASFRSTRLSDIDFTRVALANIDLTAARYDCFTRFPAGFSPARHGAVRTEARCDAADEPRIYDGIDFSGEHENRVDLSDLDLSGASFRRANLTGARFWGAVLRGADFSESVGGDLGWAADLTGANFTGARELKSLYGFIDRPAPSIEGAIFRGVTFSSHVFIGYSEEYLLPDVSRAHMEGATLTCERLVGAERNHEFDRHVTWIRWLDPRRRGIAVADSCRAIPQLRDVW